MAFKDFVKTVKSEAGDAVEVTKLKAKISKEKANIKETYEQSVRSSNNKVKEGAQIGSGIFAVGRRRLTLQKSQSKTAMNEIDHVKMN